MLEDFKIGLMLVGVIYSVEYYSDEIHFGFEQVKIM